MLETSLADAAKIVKLLEVALRKWPAESRRFAPRHGGARTRTVRRREVQHDWVRADNAWRCRICLRCHLGARLAGAVRCERCPGPRLALQQRRLEERGHRLCVAQGDGMPIKYCSRCGAWSTRRAFNLARDCPRAPSAAGRQALVRIAKGRHPWLAAGQRKEDRGFIQTERARDDHHHHHHVHAAGRAGSPDDHMRLDDDTDLHPLAVGVAVLPRDGPHLDAQGQYNASDRTRTTRPPTDDQDPQRTHLPQDAPPGEVAAAMSPSTSGQQKQPRDADASCGATGQRSSDAESREGAPPTPEASEPSCKRMRTAAAAPTREQIQRRLMSSARDHAIGAAARWHATGGRDEDKIPAEQKIQAIRRRMTERMQEAQAGDRAQDLRPVDRDGHRLDHPGGLRLRHRDWGGRVRDLAQEGRARGERRAALGDPHVLHPQAAPTDAHASSAAAPTDITCERHTAVAQAPRSEELLRGGLGLRRDQGVHRDGADLPTEEGTPAPKRTRIQSPPRTRAQLLQRLGDEAQRRSCHDETSRALDGTGRSHAANPAPSSSSMPADGDRRTEGAAPCWGSAHFASRQQLLAHLRAGRSRSPGAAAAPPRYPSTDPRASRPG